MRTLLDGAVPPLLALDLSLPERLERVDDWEEEVLLVSDRFDGFGGGYMMMFD